MALSLDDSIKVNFVDNRVKHEKSNMALNLDGNWIWEFVFLISNYSYIE